MLLKIHQSRFSFSHSISLAPIFKLLAPSIQLRTSGVAAECLDATPSASPTL